MRLTDVALGMVEANRLHTLERQLDDVVSRSRAYVETVRPTFELYATAARARAALGGPRAALGGPRSVYGVSASLARWIVDVVMGETTSRAPANAMTNTTARQLDEQLVRLVTRARTHLEVLRSEHELHWQSASAIASANALTRGNRLAPLPGRHQVRSQFAPWIHALVTGTLVRQ